jgi:general secretion pathway protein E/type IV pilus assembly protein PilB
MKQAALEQGMQTLRFDAWQKALRGESTLEEVMRVTKSDRLIMG